MSKTIDQKVVEMRFDNAQFEKNVSTSMSTLDKLKQSLNFDGAAKSFENIDRAANNVSFDKIASGVEALENRFSTMGIVGMRVIGNMTDAMIGFAKKGINFVTDSIVQGGKKRAMNLENAHFQLQGLLKDEAAVQAIMKNVNDSVDGTAYSLDAAAKVASQYAATGMRAGDKMFSALRAVAGVAAMTNSEYEETGEIFTTVAGNGRLMGEQLNQLASRGLNAAATLATYLNKSESEVRDMVSKGKISFETFAAAMDDAFGEHAKKANETFTGALSNVKAALARIGALFISPLIEQNGAFVKLFNTLREKINDIKSAMIPIADSVTKTVMNMTNKLSGFIAKIDAKMLIESLKNSFEGLMSIIKPIKEAFREIFPPITEQQLIKITEHIRDLTAKFKLNDEQSAKLKSTFKGLFSVIKLGVSVVTKIVSAVATLVGKLFGFSGSILDITGSLGDFISGIATSITKSNLFGKSVDKITGFLGKAIDKTKEFTRAITKKIKLPSFDKILNVIKKIGEILDKVAKKVSSVASGIGKAIWDIFLNGGLDNLVGLVNGGIFTSFLLDLKEFTKGLKDFNKEAKKEVKKSGGIKDSIIDVLNSVKKSLEEWQKNIKAGAILKIAIAVAVLASALLTISKVPVEKLGTSLGAVTALFGETLGALALFEKIDGDYSGAFKAVTLMIGMSISLKILASALKSLSKLSWDELNRSLIGLISLMTSVMIALGVFSKIAVASKKSFSITKKGLFSSSSRKNFIELGLSMIAIAAAMKIFASAAKDFAQIEWEGLGKAGAAITGLLGICAGFLVLGKYGEKMKTSTDSLLVISIAMKIFASSVKDFGSMSWPDLGKAGAAIAGLLGICVGFLVLGKYGDKMKTTVGSLVVISLALEIFANVCKKFGKMKWESLGKAGAAIAGLLAFCLGLALIGNLAPEIIIAAAALLVASYALLIFAPALKLLGGMSWSSIVKGLVAIAGALAILGIAGALLEPVITTILALSGAVALFGLGCLAAGAGIVMLSAGLTALAGALVAVATGIVSALTIIVVGVFKILPSIIEVLTDTIVVICEVITRSASAIGKALKTLILVVVDVIVECVPAIADGALKLIVGVIEALVKYTPKIVDLLFDFVIGIIDGLARNVPKLIKALVNALMDVFTGSIDALGKLDIDVLLKGIACVGYLTAIALGLAALAAVAPLSMIGVLALGAVIAKLAVVLAAIGSLSRIPGLKGIIYESGDFLEAIGNAIGKFVGSIVGGIGQGATDALPEIGTNLSKFMTKLQPFLDGANKLNASTFEGVSALAKVILTLTAAEILDGIASWITGGSSLADFADQLVLFGEAMKDFSATVSGNIDEGAITAAANCGKIIAEMANSIPNSGGIVSWFSGDNDLSDFGEKIVSFGKALKDFSETVSGNINEDAVTAAANCGKIMNELVRSIPKVGGLKNFFKEKRSVSLFISQLKTFGKGIVKFSKTVSGKVDEEAVTAAGNAGKVMVEMSNYMPKTGGLVQFFSGEQDMSSFGNKLVIFGKAIKTFSETVAGKIDNDAVTAAANAGKTMAEMNASLPKTGGLVQFFNGNHDMTSFGLQLVLFGTAISKFSEIVSGNVNGDAVTAAANAGKTMAEMNSSLPKTGGLVQFFNGSQDMTAFGIQLVLFGKAITSFSETISGNIDEDAVTAAANAGKTMAEMNNSLPKVGGLISVFTGSNDMASFGTQLIAFGKAITGFSETITGENAIDNDAVTAAANAGKLMAELANSLPEVGGLASKFTGGKNLDTFGSQLKNFGKGINEFSKEVSGDNAIDVMSIKTAAGVGKELAETASTLPDLNNKDLGEFGKQLKNFGKGITNFSKEVSEDNAINPDAITKAADVGKELAEVASSLPITDDKNIGDFGNQLKRFGKGITNFSKEVSGENKINPDAITKAAEVGKKLTETASTLPDIGDKNLAAFGNQLKSFGEGVSAFSKQISGIDAETLSANIDGVKGAIGKLKDVSANGMGSFVSNFTNAETKSVSAVNKMLKSLISKIKGYEKDFKSAGKKLMSEFVKGLKTDSSDIADAFKKTLIESVKLLKTYNGKFRDAGKYVADGFADGISANTYKAKAKAKAMADAASEAAAKALDERSPSKVFYGIGDYAGVAFVNALKDNTTKAYKASFEMASEAKYGLSDAIAKISDVINSDIDAQPTIRPVLDLSDVRAGASSISGMFGANPSIGVMSNVRAITSMMNGNQNGGNDDVISAIKDLGNKISGKTGDTYQINGITYDDGSNVSDAVATLVRAVRVERRR